MKYDFELLKADILKELDNIKVLESEFSKIKKMLRLPAEQVPYYDRGAIGYILHSFYNGCENIFNSVARKFPIVVKKFKTQVNDFLKKLEQEDKSEKS
jgi:hypothetical protein